MKTKEDAAIELMVDARVEGRGSTTSAKRVVKACRTLGLSDQEIRGVVAWLGYCKWETGEPWNPKIQRVWP
jgi:hypothetical protein